MLSKGTAQSSEMDFTVAELYHCCFSLKLWQFCASVQTWTFQNSSTLSFSGRLQEAAAY